MPLKVVGAGFGRTGTMSLKLALEQLGFGPCHHMVETFGKNDHIALWQAAADGNPDWEAVFEGYQSAVDWPVCYFWRELIDLYPDAKVILSKRDAEGWFKSASNTIFKAITAGQGAADSTGGGKMVKTIVVDGTFNGKLLEREYAMKVFNEHNEAVMSSIDPSRLLVFEASEGWEPLCEFLDLPVPDTEFPRVNTREETRELIEKMISGGAKEPAA